MAPEFGIFALILAFVLSLSQAFFGLGRCVARQTRSG